MKRHAGKPPLVKPPDTFCGVRHTTWVRLAKWFSIAGAGLAALITAVATAWKLIHG